MVDQLSHATEQQASDEEASEGLNLEQIRNLVGFALRAARRRPLQSFSIFAIFSALGITVSVIMPRIYTAEVTFLAQRSNAMRALSSKNAREMDAVDNPTQDVSAMIMRRDNLVALVKDAHLVELFETTRSPALKLKDRLMTVVFGPMSAEERVLSQVYTLEKRLFVDVEQDTVAIRVDWSNARTAYELVSLVQQNFLEARYDNDVAIVNDSIAVLEDHSKSELEQVDSALAEYQKLIAERTAKTLQTKTVVTPHGTIVIPRSPGPSSSPSDLDPEVPQRLEDTRTQIRSLEEAQQRAVDAVRQQLLEAQLTLTAAHPTVIALQQKLEAVRQPSPELVQLRSQERALMAKITAPRPVPSAAAVAVPFRPPPELSAEGALAAAPPTPPQLLERDGPLQLGQSKLAAAATAYEDTVSRLDAAKVELDITRASYKHRYTVLKPAEIPKRPRKPIAQLVGVGAVLAGALLGLLFAAAADLMRGIVIEPWQVKKRLKLDVIGEFDNPTRSA